MGSEMCIRDRARRKKKKFDVVFLSFVLSFKNDAVLLRGQGSIQLQRQSQRSSTCFKLKVCSFSVCFSTGPSRSPTFCPLRPSPFPALDLCAVKFYAFAVSSSSPSTRSSSSISTFCPPRPSPSPRPITTSSLDLRRPRAGPPPPLLELDPVLELDTIPVFKLSADANSQRLRDLVHGALRWTSTLLRHPHRL